MEPSDGTDSVDFLLWKVFIAVRDGTRRPRGRFSESNMAMVLYR